MRSVLLLVAACGSATSSTAPTEERIAIIDEPVFAIELTQSTKSYRLTDLQVSVQFPGESVQVIERFTLRDSNDNGTLERGEALVIGGDALIVQDSAAGQTATVQLLERTFDNHHESYRNIGTAAWTVRHRVMACGDSSCDTFKDYCVIDGKGQGACKARPRGCADCTCTLAAEGCAVGVSGCKLCDRWLCAGGTNGVSIECR